MSPAKPPGPAKPPNPAAAAGPSGGGRGSDAWARGSAAVDYEARVDMGALRAARDRPDSSDTLRGVRVPTLVASGEHDQLSPPEAARAMAALIPGAQCHVIPAAGHLAPLEQPLATGRLLADFLSGLS